MSRGRPKGYSPYINIPYEDLADFVGKKTSVKVCGKWLKELIKEVNSDIEDWTDLVQSPPEEASVANSKEQPKIEYQLTEFNED